MMYQAENTKIPQSIWEDAKKKKEKEIFYHMNITWGHWQDAPLIWENPSIQ